MGNRVFGCDDCQLFCPWNRFARTTSEPDFSPRHQLDSASLVEMFRWSKEMFDKKTQGSAIRRISYEQWQRNLAVGLGNGSPSNAAIAALKAARDDASTMVIAHIDWALERLGAAVSPTPVE